MGSKNKLKRFKENQTFKNVIQPERDILENDRFELKGQWHKKYFKNERPIVLELGCGKGEYTLHLAAQNPDKNFIGIDIKGARFWRGAKTALEQNCKNVAFVRAQIELIENLFADDEVAEIWITFPDPQIKFKRSKHRLTHPDFLNRYRQILRFGGSVHLKTDSEFLYGYTLGLMNDPAYQLIYAHHDIYNNPHAPLAAVAVQTFYEKMFLKQNKPITYLQFLFN
jgi:tRNA (guanine-N7-)-methyltransferase